MSSVPTHAHSVRVSRGDGVPHRHDRRSALFVSIVAALAGLLFGYDTGVISGALLFIKSSFHLGSGGQSVVVSAVLVGAVLGSGLAMFLGDRVRRRTLIFASALVFIVGSIISADAPSAEVLIAARAILGIAIGLSSAVVPVYIAEVSPERHRGGYVAMFQLAVTIGIFLAYLIDLAFSGSHGWRWMFVLGEPDPDASVKEIEHSITDPKSGWRELLVPFARRALLIGLGLGIFQQAIGINTVIYYAPTILQFAGFKSATVAILATLGVGAVNVVSPQPSRVAGYGLGWKRSSRGSPCR